MGFLLKALGVGLAAAGARHIIKSREEEQEKKKKQKMPCKFDGKISKVAFYDIVKRSGKGIARLTSLYADDAMVHGTTRSHSGLSDWNFSIDFNDSGKLTGKYEITTDNYDSDIPEVVASRIVQQLNDYPHVSEDTVNNYKKQEIGEYCPFCGKKNPIEYAMFCTHCGKRLRNA